MFLSIQESTRHKLHTAHGPTLVPPSLCGWEAFPMPQALTHTRITWVLSPTAPQVPGVTLGSLLCPWCFGHSSWRGGRQYIGNSRLCVSSNVQFLFASFCMSNVKNLQKVCQKYTLYYTFNNIHGI